MKRWIPFFLIAAAGVLTAFGIRGWSGRELAVTRESYLRESHARTRAEAEQFSFRVKLLYQSLRTIARLPGVKAIRDAPPHYDEQTRESVQEIYNNLASNLDLSEIYIVPADIQPDPVDSLPGRPEVPYTTFDELIVGRSARSGEEKAETDSVPEIEIHEYRQMAVQAAWFRRHAPAQATIRGLDYPAIGSPKLVTCDNRLFDPRRPDDEARSGLVYSVPFYGPHGELRGMVSGVILASALGALLGSDHMAVRVSATGFVTGRPGAAAWRRWLPAIRSGRSDPGLSYREELPLDLPDVAGRWRLWSGLPLADFETRKDVLELRRTTRMAYWALALAVLVLWAFYAILLAWQRHSRRVRLGLEDLVQSRTAALVLARDEAVSAAAAKSDFLATMSHEIRTPMNGVLGFTELLVRTPLNEEQKDLAGTIHTSAVALLSIIDDILDFSKLESGKLRVEREPFDVTRTLAEVRAMLRPRADESRVDLSLAFPDDLPRTVLADPGRVRQVLLNLVGNAVKFSPEGSVTVRVTRPPGGPSDGHPEALRIEVADTGIGIPAEKLPLLFSKFTQVDASTTRRFGGTGLGLAISRLLVEQMGGEIGVESTPGAGSTFWFTLPTAPAAEQRPPAPAPVPAAGAAAVAHEAPLRLRVLVAEDHPVNQKLVLRLLTNMGCEPELAANGREAVELFERGGFDLVIMDCHMPEMDGFEASRAIRSLESGRGPGGRRTPIVALTATVMPKDRERCFEVGMDEVLFKPVRPDELGRVLRRLAA